MGDSIVIEQLELSARLGITAQERAHPQRLTTSVTLWPSGGFSALDDHIENALDYARVCQVIKGVAAERPRNLMETLAEEISIALIDDFNCASVDIELRKYVIPDAAYVAVRISRSRGGEQLRIDEG
jgi:7,8-dihydroneopterin aldolase/epimerase/oxygenase